MRTSSPFLFAVVGFLLVWGHSSQTPAFDRTTDSLALVDLYDSTNGPGWITQTNWKSPTQGVNTWYGVTVTSNRVSQLDLTGDSLRGPLPASLGNLTSLTSLILEYNHISGSIPSSLCSLTNLKYLYLSKNKLTGSIPSTLGNLKKLERLYLYSNQLSGSIPQEIGDMDSLRRIYINGNSLTGQLPCSIGNLSKLTDIRVNNNQLSGTLPNEISNLANLQQLLLAGNQFSGALPDSIGKLSNLNRLEMHVNSFSGIPAGIGDLSNLKYFYFAGNAIANLPDEITDIVPTILEAGSNEICTPNITVAGWLNKYDSDWAGTQDCDSTHRNMRVVGYWNLNENTGTTAYDLSGYENNGTLYGPAWTTGKEGYGLDFDGSDDYVVVPHSSRYQFGTGSFSVCAWVSVDSANNDTLRPVVVKDNYNYSENRIAFYLCTSHSDDGNHGCYENYGEHCDEGKPFFAITDGNMEGGGKTILAWSTDILTSGWHHLVGIRNTAVDSIYIYVDGVKKGAAYDTLSAMNNTAPLLFGTDPYSPSPLEFYDGILDEVRLYNTVLSQGDITYLAQGGLQKGRIAPPQPARVARKMLPTKLGFHSISPNPARNSVRIQYTIPAEKNQDGEYASNEVPVKIEIFSVEGKLVRTLVNRRKPSGLHFVGWDGTGPEGGPTRAGVYIVRFSSQRFQQNLRLTLNR